MTDEENKSAENKKNVSQTSFPPWVKRIGKLMIFFAILGCIFMIMAVFLLSSVIENALSGHGL